MKPDKWVKIPVEIEAMRWDGTASGAEPIINWVNSHMGQMASYHCIPDVNGLCPGGEEDHNILIRTLEGDMVARAGYYIIKGVEGEFYGCEPNIFHKTYGPA